VKRAPAKSPTAPDARRVERAPALTASYAARRRASHRTLTALAHDGRRCLHWYDVEDVADEGYRYQLTLRPWMFAPPPPTWREFFVSEGIPHRTDKEVEKICCWHSIEPGDFIVEIVQRVREGSNAQGHSCVKVDKLMQGGGAP
jgi:hypothetical protein